MFGFGDKKEDKLEENMKEIKDLIDKGGQTGEESPDSAGETQQKDQLKEEIQNFDTKFSGEQEQSGNQFSDTANSQEETGEAEASQQGALEETASFDDQPAGETSGFDQDAPDQTGDRQDTLETPAQSQPGTQTRSGPEQQTPPQPSGNSQPGTQTRNSGPQEDSGQSRETEPSTSNSTDKTPERSNPEIPKPPETREIDVPEIEKGPLFIKQQKFESAQEMIHEMRYLSQEIEQVINRLEDGIRQDQQTEREARELLHSLEEDRRGVKSVISPKEDN